MPRSTWCRTPSGPNIQVTEQYGYLFLFAGDALLVAGSLLPGI